MFYTPVAKQETDALGRPLLDSDHDSNGSNTSMSKENTLDDESKGGKESKASSKYNEYLAGRIYASNAPKIFLETITARTATLIIALTYIFFIVGFCIDFYTTYKSFHSSNYQLKALPCAESDLNQTGSYQSCSSGKYWNATVTHLQNIISVKLDVEQQNISSKIQNVTNGFGITYNVNLWACYDKGGCDNQFASDTYYTQDPDTWQRVYSENGQKMGIDVSIDVSKSGDVETLSKSIIPSTFQNQESIPTNGLVKSYFVSVEYLEDPYHIFVGESNDTYKNTFYNFDVVERPRQPAISAINIVLLTMTLSVLVWYINMLMHQKKVLSEQKWVVGYFLLLVMFQNPVYCVIVFYRSAPSVNDAYVSYVIGYIAQAGLFVLWLLFADSVHRKTQSKLVFYGPKILIGLTIFTFSILILTFQFPGLSGDGERTRSAVEAVANWAPGLKKKFIAFTIIYLLLIFCWTIWWFIRLFLTGQRLKKLPYMSTRYIQLSYRFFSLQATLVTFYYLFQYAVVIFFISQGVTTKYDSTTLTDNINILFRQQTQLFGKTLFLTVYALIIAFLFLPSSLMSNQQGLVASLSATYVISEQEHRILVKTRKILIGSAKRNLLNQINLVGQITGARADVFCVDRALDLRNVAFQAYYDPPRITTASAYGEQNLDAIGYEFIDMSYNAEHEVFCFICREKATGRLVVAFRGTASKKQMEANLKYTQRAIVFGSLTTSTLDHLDGLSIKPSEELNEDNDFELDSVSDDEQDEADLGLESAHGVKAALAATGASGTGGSSGKQRGDDHSADHTFRETISDGAGVVGGGLKRVLRGAADVGHAVVDRAVASVETAGGLVTSAAVAAASKTPVLKNIVKLYVHSGFWEAYEHVRDFIHAILRRELVKNPTTVYFTGHSLGGALATFAALDVTMHTVPRVNAWLKHQEKLRIIREREMNDIEAPESRPSIFTTISRTFTDTLAPISHFASSTFMPRASTFNSGDNSMNASQHHASGLANPTAGSSGSGGQYGKPTPYVKKIKIFMYNYGSPKVGNGIFANFYDRMVPSSYRVVVDGDIVPALPPQSKYSHIGTEILIDSVGAGSIIIDPSFVERWLRTHMKSSVAVHSLLVYRKGLLGIKLAAEFMRENAMMRGSTSDPLRLALKVRTHHQVNSILDENAGIAVDLELREAESEISQADRATSVSDEIGKRVPCLPPLEERDIESNSPAIDLAQLCAAKDEKFAREDDVKNPLSGDSSPALSRRPTERTTTVQNSGIDRDHAASHYQHDVENMEALRSQIAAMQTPGPVRWIQGAAARTLTLGGQRGGQESGSSKIQK